MPPQRKSRRIYWNAAPRDGLYREFFNALCPEAPPVHPGLGSLGSVGIGFWLCNAGHIVWFSFMLLCSARRMALWAPLKQNAIASLPCTIVPVMPKHNNEVCHRNNHQTVQICSFCKRDHRRLRLLLRADDMQYCGFESPKAPGAEAI